MWFFINPKVVAWLVELTSKMKKVEKKIDENLIGKEIKNLKFLVFYVLYEFV